MTGCDRHTSGLVELYFYGELDSSERAELEHHLPGCRECRRALDDLRTIGEALSARPGVAAPPDGDWAPFMARLDDTIRREPRDISLVNLADAASAHPAAGPPRMSWRGSHAGYLALAALLTLVTISVLFALRTQDRGGSRTTERAAGPALETSPAATTPAAMATDAAFAAVSEQHFERSKLVVLGLATKDPADTAAADWQYERDLAGTLLKDTRLYRLAAEERGLTSLARVMEDLELVLLQASMSDQPDASSLEQLQRVIRKRDLVTKMGVVTTTAGI